MNIVNCDRIAKSYSNGKIALEDITLCIEKGEKVGLIGSIGAGKTTLLRILASVLSITSGTVNIGVQKNKIAYMPVSKGLTINMLVFAWMGTVLMCITDSMFSNVVIASGPFLHLTIALTNRMSFYIILIVSEFLIGYLVYILLKKHIQEGQINWL